MNHDSTTLDLLQARTKRLEKFSYALDGGQFGLDTAFGDGLEVDEKRMAVWVPYADGNRRDGVGDLLEVGGIDFSRHRLNPIHLFDHGKNVQLPVGKVEDPETGQYTGTVDMETKSAKDLVFFWQGKGVIQGLPQGKAYEHALFCQQLFALMAEKYVRAGSIGYQVKHARPLGEDYQEGTPRGLHLLSVLKLESSSVVLPANGDTVRKALALPSLCGKPLSQYLVKSLTPYVPEAKSIVVSGFKSASQPSEGISPEKARQILKDGTVHGKPLTDKQRRMFGAAAGQDKGMKDLRRKYREKAVQRPAETAFSQNYIRSGQGLPEIGQTVVARTYLTSATGSSVVFRSGERLKVIGHTPYGENIMLVRVRNKEGQEGDLWPKDVRKSLDAMIHTKSDPKQAMLEAFDRLDRGSNFLSLVDLRRAVPLGRQQFDNTLNALRRDGVLTMSAAEGRRGLSKEQQEAMLFEPGESAGLLYVARRKHLGMKSLPDVRRKYRSVGSVRRRHRKSTPGVSTVYVRDKDLSKLKQEAEAKGLKFERAGAKGDLERVRLTGDDGAIDTVAKMFGRVKSLNVTGTKAMPTDTDATSDQSQGEYDYSTEKHGAQLLRRAHEDHSLLMKDYDDLMGPLENEHVRKHFESHLGTMEKFLSDTEKVWGKHYKDYPPLTGAMDEEDKDLTEDEAEDIADDLEAETADTEEKQVLPEDQATSADADREEEEPTEEEVIEGMETKSLKNVRKKYKGLNNGKTKGYKVRKETRKSPHDRSKTESGYFVYFDDGDAYGPYSTEAEAHQVGELGKSLQTKGLCQSCGKSPCACKKFLKNGKTKTKDLTQDEAAAVADDIEKQTEDTEVAPKGLDQRDRKAVGEAGDFLGELSQPESQLDDEGRMRSYHYHKTLDGIASLGEVRSDLNSGENDIPPSEWEPGVGAKAAPGSPEWEQEEAQEPEHQDGGRKMCKAASGWFKQLSVTKDFGDTHRSKSAHWHKLLKELADTSAGESKPEEAELAEMGDMGEKGLALVRKLDHRDSKLDKWTRLLDRIAA